MISLVTWLSIMIASTLSCVSHNHELKISIFSNASGVPPNFSSLNNLRWL